MQPFSLEDMGSLALLAKVVELRSFSAAARDLGLAKSAVSKRISVLEKKLGVRLLVRTTRQVTLSETGLRVHEHCAALLLAARGAAEALQATTAGERGLVRINAPGLFAQRVLAPMLQHYLTDHPHVETELNSDDAMIDLTSGRFDIVVRIARSVQQQGVVLRVLAQDNLVLVASPDYLAREGEPQDPHELVHHSCLRYSPRSAGVEWRFKCSSDTTTPFVVPVRSRFAAGDDASLREAAVAGIGLTIMPRCFVVRELESGQLNVVLAGRLWEPERTIHAVLPEGQLASVRAKKLVSFLADSVSLNPNNKTASGRKRAR
jgi:DNA-binding transcriptional LysR family regulator